MDPDKENATEDEEREEKVSCFWSPKFAIYCNYILSSWGDRMWHFAVGLYLVYFDDGVLLLAAVYGFTCGGAVLLLGGVIGQWVDRNQRLKVVRMSLFIQNLCVMGSAIAAGVILYWEEDVDRIWNGKLSYLLKGVMMLLAIVAQLASVAYKIAIEKDWIVILAAGDSAKLANLNAVTRSLDLLCNVLSPTAVGQIMTFGSLLLSAVFIACWNLFSVFVEYALLSRVYKLVPRLHYKDTGDSPAHKKTNEITDGENEEEMKEMLNGKVIENTTEGDPEGNQLLEESKDNKTENKQSIEDDTEVKPARPKKSLLRLVFNPCITLYEGWQTYARQKVVYAGMSLAFLFMTVLGFDSITVGYMYAQGVTPAILGAATAVAGLMGIIGTFLFTRIRKRVGLERTGVIAFSTEIAFLTLAVVSVWAPGSPFNLKKPYNAYNSLTSCNQTISQTPVSLIDSENGTSIALLHRHPRAAPHLTLSENYFGESGDDFSLLHLPYLVQDSEHPTTLSWSDPGYTRNRRDISNNTSDYTTVGNVTLSQANCEEKTSGVTLSVIIFLIGIVLSRIGLWMADMTVNQLLQECVVERERGVVGGVQSSLNMLMDVLKFTMVIVAPHIETFGILIIISYCFIIMGGLCFLYHVYSTDCGRKLKLTDDLEMKDTLEKA